MKRPLRVTALLALAPTLLMAAEPGERLSFVSCPIVRDTRSVPCWLSEYQGDLYYLTIQSDVSAEVQPPMLGHQVLVEGVVSGAAPICGGVVLDEVRLSVMPERDANCNTMLPADDRYTIDFNPRPPGPSSGRLAFQAPPPDPNTQPAAPPERFDLYFDMERGVSFRHPGQLVAILRAAAALEATGIEITGLRGVHRLSNETLLREAPDMGQRRAEEVAELLQGAGLALPLDLKWADGESEADGVEDWRSRRVTVVLTR